MDCVSYGPGFTGGSITVPPSKSAAIRALLCGALSCRLGHGCTVANLYPSEDILATAKATESLGAALEFSGDGSTARMEPDPNYSIKECKEVDCGESGSLLRFIIPIAAAIGGRWRFTGRGRLPRRPIGVYAELLPSHGVRFTSEAEGQGLPLAIEGKLAPGRFAMPGNISSQFVTGMLMALPLLEGDSELVLTSPLESRGYVDMTLDVLKDFGVTVRPTAGGWQIPGGQRYVNPEYRVEGDWSQAAFFLNIAALSPAGAQVRLEGLKPDSLQGDRACVEVFGNFGLDLRWEDGVLVAQNPNAGEPYGGLRGQTLDVSNITDMVPAASVCAALSRGETRFENAGRLRLKESDRLEAMKQAVNALGGKASEAGDTLVIHGVERLKGGRAQGCNDHRVVMALAGAGLRSASPVEVTDAYSINKTYPTFFDEYRRLGGEARVFQLG